MAAAPESPEKCWIGTSMDDIYRGHGPWGFEVPPITASRYHAVLFQLPITLKSPPKPHYSAQIHHWDNDHVRMPFSPKNLFPVKDENGEEVLQKRWELIQLSLLQPINSSKELEAVISSYNTRLPRFLALHHFFEEILEEEESQLFFESLLPGIIRLALQLPEILPGNLPLLKHGACRSISLSQLQIASLLANAFLCTFPWRKDSTGYPGINFVRLFAAHLKPDREQSVAEKLKCVCNYFRRVLATDPIGVVTFERKHFPKSQLPRWDRWDNNLGNTRIHVSGTGVIEDDADGLLQVDFANKNVGGGVLGFGCVQEEIRFIICPELIISRLFTEQLGATEALVIIGAERYSKYTGYGESFVWAGNCKDNSPYDDSGRKRTNIVAIDALHFNRPNDQYNPSCILRELNKAYVGFHSRFEGQLPAVATGNWGCGAFRGDPNLKFLIQLMACSAARRDMVYFTFGDAELRDSIHEIYLFLATNQITITQLWRYLCRFAHANVKPEHLFSFIQQAHFDNKSQLSIKDFFCFNKKKPDTKNDPSTSNTNRSPDKNSNPDGINSNIEEFAEDTVIDISPTQSTVFDSDVDIIESSQTEQKSKRQLPKVLKEFDAAEKTENSQKKREYIQDDILDLFKTMDNDSKKPDRNIEVVSRNSSLLSSIDEYAKKIRDDKVKHVKESERMDIDEAMDSSDDNKKVSSAGEVNDSSSTSMWSESTPKRRITDYFVKIDKG